MSRAPVLIHDEPSRQRVVDLVSALSLAKPWQITIEPKKKRRTPSQNALYWRWLEIIADETGNDKEDVHEALKAMYCPERKVRLGDSDSYVRSTAKLETATMSEYMDRIYAWVTSELGILLPLPEELGRTR